VIPVSLVITSYNRDRYLATAIASVLSQTYIHFELLVWDDGSTDDSVKVAQSYAQQDSRVRVVAAAHQGLSTSLKSAIAASSPHPYLGWVDSDDALAPTALAETVAVLSQQPETGMVYTDYCVMNADGQIGGLGSRCRKPYSPERLLVEFMTFHFRLLRRSVYEQVGGIDSTFERAEDYDLCLKFSEVSKIHHLKRSLYFYRQHGENVTNDVLEMLHWTYRASQQALQRRGLAERYEIRISSELKLHMKPEKWPLVSIIIPCYNAIKTIEDCLRSCFEQVYPHLEILVVDNNSTDNTAQLLTSIAESAPRSFQVLSCLQQGQNYARNLGFSAAKGEYIQWLDADDRLTPDKLMRQVMALENNTEYDLAYSDWQWQFYQQRRLVHQFAFQGAFKNDWLLELLMDNWRPWHTYILRRRVAAHLHQHPTRDLTTKACTDREYFTLAALAGFKPMYVAGSNVQYTTGLSSHQITQSTPYDVRVQSLRAMFGRFRQQAEESEGVNEVHWLLLNQNWELCKPAFDVSKQEGQHCWLKHRETGEEWEVSGSEARIAKTWLKLPGTYTLEDQARRIVLQLWREGVLWLRQTKGLETALNEPVVKQELGKVLGLVPAEEEVCPEMPLESVRVEPEVAARVKLPLYVPRFGKERFRVLMVLQRLRQKDNLDTVD